MGRTCQNRSEDDRMMVVVRAILLLSMLMTSEILAAPVRAKFVMRATERELVLKHIAELFCQVKSIDGQAKVKNDSNLFKNEDNVLCGKNNKGGLCSSLCEDDDNIQANIECIAKIVTHKGIKADEMFHKFCVEKY